MSTAKQRLKWREQKRAYMARTSPKALAALGCAPTPTGKASNAHKDAVVYLRHAETAMTESLRAGRIKKLDRAHLLALLALSVLA
jgi:hypothetical protein